MFDLSGKTAIITGASRGIGLAIAEGLAAHGADVVLVARGLDRLETAARRIETQTLRRAQAFAFDLAEPAQIEGLFDHIVEAVGQVDILVNAAGTTVRGPSADVSLESITRVMDVNFHAALVLSQAFGRHCMKAGRPGRIINIGSLLCNRSRPTVAAYSASKAALLSLTRTLAVEWAPHDINVNAIGPGYIATDLTAPLQADADLNQWVLSKTPLGRWGRPEDLVGTAVLLAAKAGDFITGQIFYVDGGWMALV